MKSIKKVLCLLITMLLLVSVVTPVMAQGPIKVIVGGKRIRLDVWPDIINDRTMVPLRAIFEELGADVDWNGETRTVTSTKGETTIKLTIDDPVMYVNGEEVALDSPACIVENRTLVPVRAISEAFDLKVEWDSDTRTVRVRVPTVLQVESSYNPKIEYDDYGREIYTENTNGSWCRRLYDDNGNMTEYYSNGTWYKYEYNEYGDEIYFESSDYWNKSVYDDKGNMTYYRDSDGFESRSTYDSRGNEVFYENTNGFWSKSTYDAHNNLTYYEDSDGYWYNQIYDEYGNYMYYGDSTGYWEKYSYSDNTKDITYSDGSWEKHVCCENGDIEMYSSSGYWTKEKYDANGNMIYYEDSEGHWSKYEYDERGNETYYESSSGYWYKNQYDESGNLSYFEDSDGDWEKYITKEI